LFTEESLFDVVIASDIVVGVRTSALVTAMLAKKPTILINFDPSVADFFPEIEDEIVGIARSNAELSKMMKEVVIDSNNAKDSSRRAEKYARKYVPYDNATDRVIKCFLELIEDK